MARKYVFFSMVYLMMMALAGCGDSTPTGPEKNAPAGNAGKQTQPSLMDPCTIITKADADAALGEPVKIEQAGTSVNPLNQKKCVYLSTRSDRFIMISILQTVGLRESLRANGESAASIYKRIKENLDPVTPIEGIGDDACWGTPGLHILKGDTYLVIGVGSTDNSENLELAKHLAKTGLSRL
jgi:predicted small lipoprotein YifL